MKEFKVGDEFVYCPGNEVCLIKIMKIRGVCENKGKIAEYRKFTYVNNTYDDDKYESGAAPIMRDEKNGKEYIQVDHWVTHKYCIRHIIYCE